MCTVIYMLILVALRQISPIWFTPYGFSSRTLSCYQVSGFFVFRCFAIQLPLIELICLYGYSLVPYYPVTMLCLIPVAWLEWIFILAGTCVSCLLILRNIAGAVLSSDVSQQKAGPLLGSVIGCHVIFFLVLKLMFYHHHK